MPSASRDPLLRSIGGTPLVELTRLSPRPGVRLWAKLEGMNPSGSIKDRVALALVEEAEARGQLQPGGTLIEASTGNTAIALATVARRKGYRLKVVLPEGVVPSIRALLELYGVEILWTRPRCGMMGAIDLAVTLAEREGWVATRQFDSPANLRAHYEGTGAEIAATLPRVDAFVAGIGTAGTLMGVGRRLRERDPEVRLIGVEPRMGEHLQGLRSLEESYRPPMLRLEELSGRFLVPADRALCAAQRVVREEGILAGVSSGAALHAALQVAQRMDEGDVVVMFSDGGWKYLPAQPWQDAQAGRAELDEVHWW